MKNKMFLTVLLTLFIVVPTSAFAAGWAYSLATGSGYTWASSGCYTSYPYLKFYIDNDTGKGKAKVQKLITKPGYGSQWADVSYVRIYGGNIMSSFGPGAWTGFSGNLTVTLRVKPSSSTSQYRVVLKETDDEYNPGVDPPSMTGTVRCVGSN